ncbi:hypothetical protein RB213_012451 [Colletotrichum asianum]
MSIAFFPLRTVRAPHVTSIRTAPPLRSSAWCLVAKTNPVNVTISLRQNHTKMAVLFSAFSFFQDSLSRRPQRGPAQPTEKKAFPLPSPDIKTSGVDSAWGADISETCLDGQPSAIPARPGIVLLIRIMSTRV